MACRYVFGVKILEFRRKNHFEGDQFLGCASAARQLHSLIDPSFSLLSCCCCRLVVSILKRCHNLVTQQLSYSGCNTVVIAQCSSLNGCRTVVVTQWLSHSDHDTVVTTQWLSHSGQHTVVVTQLALHSGCQTVVFTQWSSHFHKSLDLQLLCSLCG